MHEVNSFHFSLWKTNLFPCFQLWVKRREFSALLQQLPKDKENIEFKQDELHLKIDIVLYPAYGSGVEYIYIYIYI